MLRKQQIAEKNSCRERVSSFFGLPKQKQMLYNIAVKIGLIYI